MYPPWGPLLVLLVAWAAGEAPSTPPTPPLGSNEVLKLQETERTEEQNLVTENGIGNLESKQNEGATARWPVSPSPSSIVVSPGPIPVPTPLCPGDQVVLGGGAGCGCPAGLTKEGERCVCPAGFQQQGAAECQDVDECAGEARNACGLHANCTNTAGSFTCSCHRGYLKGPAGDCQENIWVLPEKIMPSLFSNHLLQMSIIWSFWNQSNIQQASHLPEKLSLDLDCMSCCVPVF